MPTSTSQPPTRRQRIARRSSGLLIGVACLLPLVGQLRLGGLPVAILLACALVCTLLGSGGDPSTKGLRAPLWVLGLLAGAPLLVGLTLLTWPRVGLRSGELTELVESFGAPAGQTAHWNAWDVALRWIAERDPAAHGELDLARARAAIQAALAGRDEPPSVSPYVLGQAADNGLIDAWLEQDAELGASAAVWARRSTPINYPDQRRHLVRALELRGELDPALRDALAARTLAAWDVEDEFAQLAGLDAVVRFLELLERSELTAPLASDAATLLERCYLRDLREHPWLGVGGDSFRSHANRPESIYPDLGAVLAALDLMQRFGVPSTLDLRALRDHLRGKAHRFQLMELDIFGARAAVALAELEARFPEAAGLRDPWRPSERDLAAIAATLLGVGLVAWSALAGERAVRARCDAGRP